MNILFVDKRFPNYGGVASVTSMLGKCFIKDGHRVFVATLLPKLYEQIEALTPEGIEIVELNQPTWNLKNISKLKKIIKNKQIDVIINQWALHFEVGFMCHMARRGTNCKLICELHGAPDTTKMIIRQTEKTVRSKKLLVKQYNKLKLYFCHLITRISIRYVYRICDSYVLLSKGFIPVIQKYAALKDISKFCAIGNAIGISADGYKYDSSKKQKKLLYVGRMDKFNKRVNRILEAWEILYKSYPDWSLDLVGEGPQLNELKDYVKDREIDRVNFYGFQKDPPRKFYEKASVLLLTSDLEGFGLVIIEAMQFGVVPVVYGSYVAVYDIIDNGINGFITPMPYDMNNTIACVKTLIDKDELRHKMGVAAIEKSQKFTLDNVKEVWYSIMLGPKK